MYNSRRSSSSVRDQRCRRQKSLITVAYETAKSADQLDDGRLSWTVTQCQKACRLYRSGENNSGSHWPHAHFTHIDET